MKLGIGILIGFAGVVLVVTSKSAGASVVASGWGDMIMLLSMLAYVIGGLLIKKLSAFPIPTLVVTAYSTIIGGVMLNAATIVMMGPSSYTDVHVTALAWIIMLLSAWGASSLGTLGWNHGIKRLGANRTAMFINAMPFASMVGGILFLNERIGWIHAAAFVMTTLGIVVGMMKTGDRGRLPLKTAKSAQS
nr:DMT family transporter [Paenibacillus piri]